MSNKNNSICRHCGATIKHVNGRLWRDDCKVFPQYCITTEQNQGGQLHEPVNQVYQVTYDRVEDYDPEYSSWKRQLLQGTSYEQVSAEFHAQYPGNKIFSINEMFWNHAYSRWDYVPLDG